MTIAPADDRIEVAHNCQTADCPNDFQVIQFDVRSSETNYLCMPCCLAFWMAVIERVAGQVDGAESEQEAPAPPPQLCICIGQAGSNPACGAHAADPVAANA